MNKERWERIKEILDQALTAPAGQRLIRLRESLNDDPSLVAEVEALLQSEGGAGGFLDEPLFYRSSAEGDETLAAGSKVGPYQVVRLLGRGGMGEVYLAQRVDDFNRQVALKVIRFGLRRPDLLRRFLNERQILARLEHPNVARLLDGGTTAEGLPYLVMEYVDGERLDVYAARHKLSVRQRIELFLKIFSAFAELHRNLIVHRDLKPSNILVTRDGEPRLLDFGVAKLLHPGPLEAPFDTQLGQQVLTPVFASPEQLRNEPITTASDIYSLGVLLYELFTGHLPYAADPHDLGALFHEICAVEPEAPSAGLRRRGVGPGLDRWGADGARRRALELAGDLDSIVLKALRKRPEERYGTVEQMADDFRLHLAGLPVRARQSTALYWLGKLVRRRKLATAAVLLIVLLAAVSLLFWHRAVGQRDLAVHERQRAEGVASFLTGLFQEGKPDASGGRQVTVREVVEQGRRQLEKSHLDPAQRADLASTLAGVYRELGAFSDARDLFAASVALRRQDALADGSLLAKELSNLAGAEYRLGETSSAEGHLREALGLRHSLGQRDDEVVVTQNNLASLLLFRGAFEDAEELYRQGLAIRLRLHGPDSPEVASSLFNLGALAFVRCDLRRAEELLRRALALRLHSLGAEHTLVAAVLATLGRTLHAHGDLAGAEAFHSQALAIRLKRLGDRHPDTAISRRDLAAVLIDGGRLSEAGRLVDAAEQLGRESTPEGAFWIASAESVRGAYLAARGDQDAAAEQLLARSYGVILRLRGPRCIYTRQAASRLFHFYSSRGNAARAAVYRAEAMMK
jgi:serine/threonine-protein kinase